MVVLVLLALLVAVVALAVAGLVWRRVRSYDDGPGAPLPSDVAGLRAEVAALRKETASSLRHLAVVRYDAFSDMGGQLSWSMAVVDDGGDGVLLTSIHGRNDARSYAKSLRAWACAQQLSPEEEQALEQARPKR